MTYPSDDAVTIATFPENRPILKKRYRHELDLVKLILLNTSP